MATMALGGGNAVRRARRWVTNLSAIPALIRSAFNAIGQPLFTAAGFGCIDAGAFVANTVAGFVVTGVSLLLMSWAAE